MRRLRYLFAGLILLLALPVWRLLDWANVTLPFQTLTAFSIVLWSSAFVLLPLKLLIPSMNRWISILMLLSFGTFAWIAGPHTNQATLEPSRTHCGRMSYAGFFYPVRAILTNAHQDDLEARNQMCWLVKMISKVPSEIAAEDLAGHLNIMKYKLMKPAQKYRASLPWITILLGKYLTSSEIQNSPLLVQNLGFWSNLYAEEISGREYAWYNWPHSAWIKFEYGFIEKNWGNIQIEFNK
jgi:hypothetical protein